MGIAPADPPANAAAAPLRVIALASYPVEAATTRLRVSQLAEALAQRNIRVTLLPFLGRRAFGWLYDRSRVPLTAAALALATVRRLLQLPRLLSAEVVFVQREAMLFGPPLVEWFATRVLHRPLVLDLDDATYIPVKSPLYGRLAGALKWPHKTDWLIDRAAAVVCGNATIAAYVRGRGRRAVVLPTIVDTDVFVPRDDGADSAVPVIGWVGSHSTFPFLESILPVLERLSEDLRFQLRIVGSGQTEAAVRVADVELASWALDREVDDFRNIDIGLYPLNLDAFSEGKSGLKAVIYLAVGVPFVASPVGIVAEIGEPGQTHFLARTPEEWYEALARLLRDAGLRRTMGRAGRRFAVEHYSLNEWAARLAETLRTAAHPRAAERQSRDATATQI